MANDKEEKKVEVPLALLEEMQKQIADMERKVADGEAKNAGLEDLFNSNMQNSDKPDANSKGLRVKKNFEPKFRTVRLRKYPVAGDPENKQYVVGFTKRGAYQTVDKSGVRPEIVDCIDIIFLGQPKKAETVKLLDFMNGGEQVHCKILETQRKPRLEPSGEEIEVSVYDPQHGLIGTGEVVDGYTGYSDITYTLQVPGVAEPLTISQTYVNI